MVFSSLLFIYLFMPLCLIIYFCVSDIKGRNNVLLVFSLVFYGWANPTYIILLMLMVFINWFCALQIEKEETQKKRKYWMIAGCGTSLLLLGVFKYTGFVMENIQNITGFSKTIINIVLPVGISFYTFQLLSYTIDVYRRQVAAEKKYSGLLLYAGLFYQCIAGPIVRYSDIAAELRERYVSLDSMSHGITRFAIGLAKKTLLANTCAGLVDSMISENTSIISNIDSLSLWIAMISYMFQIYFDFSAYSDMAIGLGEMVGIHFKENFNYPYVCTSITDFWRRWHISLSTFFKDYVYIPLGGNRKGIFHTIFNLLIVWFLTGMWHGASWNYILWGLYFFVFLVCEKVLGIERIKKIPTYICRIYSLIVVLFGWILFKFTDLKEGLSVFKGMLMLNGNSFVSYESKTILLNNIFFIILCIAALTPVGKKLYQKIKQICGKIKLGLYLNAVFDISFPTILLILSTMALVGNSYNPFLYFQF